MRGANQSLARSPPPWPPGTDGFFPVSSRPPPAAEAEADGCRSSAGLPGPGTPGLVADDRSSTGVRMTTGGIGRDPGMLILIRVVSVVSVFGCSSGSEGRPASAASGASGASCGGCRDGYRRVP
ncbi:hypothetical protein Sfr7A_04840 [Streptomyces xinghaiensis]|uniref:Uncharacterized protein n=1 Tax=Streptomyces xinghaiensis TaxID=1038928 RepID=A0A420V664_9ACTN|nr:hypothetical protein Sfr7A_04840 [Streptomyces xinghaiensis]RKM97097.1 hypothetical protein SFRA_007530 [Streptomyces xinghaiensis]